MKFVLLSLFSFPIYIFPNGAFVEKLSLLGQLFQCLSSLNDLRNISVWDIKKKTKKNNDLELSYD